MSGDLHELSVQMGKLIAAEEEARRQREQLWAKLNRVGEQVGAVSRGQEQMQQTLSVLSAVPDRVTAIEKQIASVKDRGRGILIGVGLAGGGVGGSIVAIKDWLLS